MPAPEGAPAWASELALAYESGAHGQFLLYGNVHDRMAVGGRLVNLAGYLEDELLAGFPVVLTYDLGNGLAIGRGGERAEQWGGAALAQLPREPLPAVQWVSRYLRYLGNLRALGREAQGAVALVVRGIDQIAPADGSGYEHGSLTSVLREWASESPFRDLPFTSLLIADNLNDVEPQVAFDAHAARIRVPLPDAAGLERALALLQAAQPKAFAPGTKLPELAGALVGVSVSALESLVKMRGHAAQALAAADLTRIKKDLVERDAGGLVEFVESKRTLDDYHGQDALKRWLRQDVALWQAGDLKALPMGYLLCGPVGTGKTFLVECLAGEAGVPVVKLKNFRERWVGSSEGNLEKIFRLVRALGRCMVFIDEADQALGRRESGSGDSGLSGRLYSMIAQEMADGANRGRVVWILASSRPDLIEVDLKRPGRVDVKVPILPTSTRAESAALLGALARRYGLALDAAALAALEPRMPTLLTPGAAEALVVKAYRHARTEKTSPDAALAACLEGYQNPVPADVLEAQMRLAIREATDLAFVPPAFRALAAPQPGMSKRRSYLGAAFNARPFGMPVPPNWFAVAAFGLLGAFVDPGFYLIGAGLEGLYLWALSRNSRFRTTVDAVARAEPGWDSRYEALVEPLGGRGRELQSEIEAEAAEIVEILARSGANEGQVAQVRQMAWLHLRLLAARESLQQVLAAADREQLDLAEQERRSEARLRRGDADDELRRSLEQQLEVIRTRKSAHADAARRRELVDAELERLRQQISLVREQALLATDEQSVAASLDAVSASLNEASRWLKDQREIFAGLDALSDEAPPPELLQPKARRERQRRRESE